MQEKRIDSIKIVSIDSALISIIQREIYTVWIPEKIIAIALSKIEYHNLSLTISRAVVRAIVLYRVARDSRLECLRTKTCSNKIVVFVDRLSITTAFTIESVTAKPVANGFWRFNFKFTEYENNEFARVTAVHIYSILWTMNYDYNNY